MGIGIKDYAVNTWNYTVNTLIQQQVFDTWNTLKNPSTLETAVTLAIGSEIKIPNANAIKAAFTVTDGMTLAEGLQQGQILHVLFIKNLDLVRPRL
jgi:hypothetical protein